MKKTTYIKLLFLSLLIFSTLSASAHIVKIEIKVGELAPDFTIQDPDGKEIRLSSLRGKVVLLDFWASWCMPCREANPELVNIYNNFHKLGFDIFSVSLDSKKEPWVRAIKNDKLVWPNHGSDLKGWDSRICQMYGVESIPSGFLINEEGYIIGKDMDDYAVEKKLKQLFYEQVNVYPKTAASKLYFTGKTKFQIEDQKGNILLKGKGEEIDITDLTQGEYTIKYDNKTEKFTKRNLNQPYVTFFPVNVTDKITMSRDADYEVYNGRGKIIKNGTKSIIELSDLPTGVFYLNIEGEIHKFFKR
ncbi:MAG: redoxin domain-containing protein [Cytophagaceae bacterium]